MESIPEFLNQFVGNFACSAFKYFERLMKGFLEVPGPKALTELNRKRRSFHLKLKKLLYSGTSNLISAKTKSERTQSFCSPQG